jgi:aminoglycoside phosphotransferase (APT) family kinase protein
MTGLDTLHELLTPSPLTAVPGVAEQHEHSLSGWRQLAGAGGGSGLDEWSGRNLDALADLESGWPAAAAGTTLLHCDVRADNLLITAAGVIFVDWPAASIGAPLFDVVAFAPSVALQGGPDPEWIVARSRSAAAADPDAITAVVAAVAGYFTRQALLPPPPGLPTVRAFQAAQGRHARQWLRLRTGWR